MGRSFVARRELFHIYIKVLFDVSMQEALSLQATIEVTMEQQEHLTMAK